MGVHYISRLLQSVGQSQLTMGGCIKGREDASKILSSHNQHTGINIANNQSLTAINFKAADLKMNNGVFSSGNFRRKMTVWDDCEDDSHLYPSWVNYVPPGILWTRCLVLALERKPLD